MANPFEFDPDKLKEESESAESSKRWMNGLASAADSLANIPSAADILLKTNAPKVEAGSSLRSMAAGIQDPAERQAKLYAQYKLAREAKEFGEHDTKVASQRDPKSSTSRAAKAFFSARGFQVDPNDTQESLLERYGKTSDLTKTEYEARFRPRNGGASELQKLRFEMAKKAQERAESDHLDKEVQKYSDKVAPSQEIANALGEVDNLLQKTNKTSIDTYDPEKHDLPGVSVFGLGRYNAFNDDARILKDKMSKVFNVELKDRSGAAVTDQELNRLKEEFSSGKYNTEAEMIGALKSYKTAANRVMKNSEAAFRPNVVSEYQKRGGQTLATMNRPPLGQPQAAQGADDLDSLDDDALDRLLEQEGLR